MLVDEDPERSSSLAVLKVWWQRRNMNILASAVLISLMNAVASSRHEQGLLGPRLSAKRRHLAIYVPDIPLQYRESMSASQLWALSAFGEPRSVSLENELWTSPGYRQFLHSDLRTKSSMLSNG